MNLKSITYTAFISEWQPFDNCFVARIPVGITDTQQLLEALNVRLRLPYFGFNWDALWDVLRDFHWIEKRRIVIIHEELPALTDRDLGIYLELLDDAIREWRPEEEHELVVVFPESVRNVITSL